MSLAVGGSNTAVQVGKGSTIDAVEILHARAIDEKKEREREKGRDCASDRTRTEATREDDLEH